MRCRGSEFPGVYLVDLNHIIAPRRREVQGEKVPTAAAVVAAGGATDPSTVVRTPTAQKRSAIRIASVAPIAIAAAVTHHIAGKPACSIRAPVANGAANTPM